MIWGLMVRPLTQKVAKFYKLRSRFVPKCWLFLDFLGNFTSCLYFFYKMLALSNKKSTFVLVSGFFCCFIFTISFKYYSKSLFLTEKAP